MTSLLVIKKNKKKQLFNKAKIIRACVKAGASRKDAVAIAKAVEAKLCVVSSDQIAKLVVGELRKKNRKVAREFIAYRLKKRRKKK